MVMTTHRVISRTSSPVTAAPSRRLEVVRTSCLLLSVRVAGTSTPAK